LVTRSRVANPEPPGPSLSSSQPRPWAELQGNGANKEKGRRWAGRKLCEDVRSEERIPDGVLGPDLKGLEVRPDPPALPAPIRHNLFPGTWTLPSYKRRPFPPTKRTLSSSPDPSIPSTARKNPSKGFHPTRILLLRQPSKNPSFRHKLFPPCSPVLPLTVGPAPPSALARSQAAPL
jgi:hypothetical protein